jgi:hypothetical protein
MYDNLKMWALPSCYVGETWEDYYSAGVGQSRDSDVLERSNFACMLRALGGETYTVRVVSESHWAVGWVEWIAIHKADNAALTIANDMVERLNEYPILDEDHYSELEWNESADYWDSLSPRAKVELAMYERSKCHWLGHERVWIFGRMDYSELANHGSTIAEYVYESLRNS